MFTTSTAGGVIQYTDSPLLRAVTYGRVIIIDEADKAPEHVVAIFRSLATQSAMTLSDGRRVCAARQRDDDIEVHPDFRLILLANRPGYRKLLITGSYPINLNFPSSFPWQPFHSGPRRELQPSCCV